MMLVLHTSINFLLLDTTEASVVADLCLKQMCLSSTLVLCTIVQQTLM